ncbi:MAG: homocysteine S-methyltransferase [Polyangiales bacterium]
MRALTADGRPRVLDGGLATELEARGAVLDTPLWSARLLRDDPAMIAAVHRDYLDAGADILTTAGYQATLPGLVAAGLAPDAARAVLRRAVTLACDARDAHPRGGAVLVAASLGSYGAFLADGREFRGGYGRSVEALADFHRARLAVIADAGADLLAFETVPCVEEAEAIARALADTDGPPAWVSFSLGAEGRTAQGDPLVDGALAALASPRVIAVGCNCCDPRAVEHALRVLRGCTDVDLVAYPNRGERWSPEARRWEPDGAARPLADFAAGYRAAGATVLGGCCRTTPGDIRALAKTLAAQ